MLYVDLVLSNDKFKAEFCSIYSLNSRLIFKNFQITKLLASIVYGNIIQPFSIGMTEITTLMSSRFG